jgi:hypothetical protein
MGKTYEREVEFAVGFVGGQWREVSVTVQETMERVLDDDEITPKALKILEKIDFSPNVVAFHHVLYIEDPEGGFGEDLNI